MGQIGQDILAGGQGAVEQDLKQILQRQGVLVSEY
jgi:hypothetical protein